jgi:hypothetical protein
MRRIRSLIAAAALLACSEAFNSDLTPADFYGVWGSTDGARLSISNTRTYFESSCWAGEFVVPIAVDEERFVATGTLNATSGTDTRIATLRGSLNDDALHVTVEPVTFQLGPYVMVRDLPVTILPCP